MPNAVEVSISDVRSFMDCRQKWDFNSSLRRNLVPRVRANHFAFGDLVHESLRRHYQGEDAVAFFEENSHTLLAQIDPSIQGYEKIIELVEMGPPLLAAYKKWAHFKDDFEVIDQEKRHVVRLNNEMPGIFFSFKYDMLVRRSDGVWLLDFKTTSQLPSDFDYLVIDPQSVSYQWAAEKVLGYPIKGIIYQYLRKKKPTTPEQLKSGELTRRSNLVSTVAVYEAEIERLGLDKNDYVDVLSNLASKEGENFFCRATASANQYQKQAMGEQLKTIARMMSDPEVYIYPSPERMKCTVCDYRHPCFLKQAGYNSETLLDADYKQGEPRE